MRAAVLYDVDDVRIESRAIPRPAPGELLIKTGASGICSGDVMGWYVRRKAPFVLGHEPAGTVAAVGAGAPPCDDRGVPFREGDRVFVHHHAPCFACAACARSDYVQCAAWRSSAIDPGGMAEYFRVPGGNLRDTLRLPEAVPLVDGSLVEPLACALKSLRRGGLRAGDLLCVIGLGVMGLLHVLAGAARGARVVASDPIAERRERARACGAEAVEPAALAEAIGRGADVTICGPGTPAAMADALAATAPGGTIVMFTPFEPGSNLIVDASRLYFDDLRLVASYSCGPDDTRAALTAIADGIVTAAKLGATTLGLDDVPRAYADLAASRVIKPIVVFA